MAVMASVFDETQRATLEALCDTFVPAVESDTGDPVERDFLARSAADLQVAAQIEGMLAEAMTPDEIAAVAGLLDALAEQGMAPGHAARGAHPDRPRHARRRPGGKARPHPAQGPHDAALLRRARREHGLERQLGGAGVPGAELARAVC